MARGFAGGMILGVVVVGAGLATLSQLAPLPEVDPLETEAASQPAAEPATPQQQASDPEAAKPEVMAEAPSATIPDPGPSVAPKADPAAVLPPAVSATAPQAPAPATHPVDPVVAGGAPDGAEAAASASDPASVTPTDSAQPQVAGLDGLPAPETPAIGTTEPAEAEPSSGQVASPGSDPAVQTQSLPEGTPATPPPASVAQSAEPAPDAKAPLVQSAGPAAPDASPLPPAAAQPATTEAPPSLASLDAALSAPPPQPAAPEEADLGVTEAPDLGDVTAPPQSALAEGAGLARPSGLPQISAEPDPALAPQPLPLALAPEQNGIVLDDLPPSDAPAEPQIVKPDAAGLPGKKVAGLPQAPGLSARPAGEKPAGDPAVIQGDLPQIGRGAEDQAEAMGALVTFARPFVGAEGKPLFAVLLRDVGDQGLPRAQLAQLPFPVSVVIDPLAPDAAEAAAAWRAAEQEVVMLASGLPMGANATDVAQSFQAMDATLPEAVAVLDLAEAGFQSDRSLSGLVLSEIAAKGRGLLTWDQGLNAADQIARRDGLPAGVIYRVLDGAGESQPVMRRYLDRAAFKAGQEGAVVVIGDTRSDTIEALLSWALEGKGASVALAPVSALLLGAE